MRDPRSRSLVIACLLLAAPLAAPAPVGADSTVRYDALQGTLPESQGFAFLASMPNTQLPVIQAGLLHLGPTNNPELQVWTRKNPPVVFSRGCTIDATLQVISSGLLFLPQDQSQRSGFMIDVVDSTGRRMCLGISTDGVTLNTDRRLLQANGSGLLAVGTTGSMHHFQIVTRPDSILLSVDGLRRGAVALGAPVFADSDRIVQFGDESNGVGCDVLLQSLAYTAPAAVLDVAPRPGADGALLRIRPAQPLTHADVACALWAPTPASARVRVFDLHGARIRDLGEHLTGPSGAEVRWDARDASGRRVPAGGYFVVATSRDLRASCRVMLVP